MRCLALRPMVWLANGLARLPQSTLLALATAMAWFFRPLLGRRLRIARINIERCFPDFSPAEQKKLLRENIRESFMGVFDLLRAWYAPPERLQGVASIHGMEHLQAALARGQGVMLLTGHFTHTEWAVRLLSEALQRRLGGVVRHHNSPCLEAEFSRARRNVFGPTFEKKDLRGMLRALQSGEVLVYSADQNFTYRHAFVPFFGVPAATLLTTPDIVKAGRAVMLPFWFYRDAKGEYHLHIERAWPGWGEADAHSAGIYMQALENVVRQHPAQYLWMHRRFRTRPAGETPFYR